MKGDLTKRDDHLLSILKNTPDLAKPFEKDIFLVECHVAGVSFVEDIFSILGDLQVGDRLNFYRQEGKTQDQFTINVENEKGQRIGEVPKDYNLILARLMDGGKLIYGQVSMVKRARDWSRVNMKVYFKG